MRKFIFAVIGAIALLAAVSVMTMGSNSSLSLNPFAQSSAEDPEGDEPEALWIDTVMYAKGHAFGFRGDITDWGGWYFDTVYVGEDRMMTYDSVGPSTLKLSLVTRDLILDLGDPYAILKIKNFMQPLPGFKLFRKSYEQCLDSVVDEEYGAYNYMGSFTFLAECPDSSIKDRAAINRFICDLSGISESEKVKIPGVSALYAGISQTKNYRPVYTGDAGNIESLSDFLALKTFENWIRGGEFGMGSSEYVISIKANIYNPRFVTLSKFEYDRIGSGHGMYTETFHTMDMQTGKELSNEDIFIPKSEEKVKELLYDVMSKDPRYTGWNRDVKTADDVRDMMESRKSGDGESDETESGEDSGFILPEGALTGDGILFSFQPYEIGCWASGAFHFVVPYRKLMPFLTKKAKLLIK